MSNFGWRLFLFVMLPLCGAEQSPAAELKALLEPVPGVNVRKPSVAPEKSASALEGGESQAPQVGMVLSDVALARAIQQDLPKRFPVRGELGIQLVKPWTPLRLPGADFFAECIQLSGGALNSNMSLMVRGVSAGRIVGEWPMQVRVEMWQEVWVASQRLERGQVLTPGMLVGQRIDLLREPGQVVAVDADVEGLELAQVVQQGRPISRRDLVERSLVRRGQFVDAVANEGGLNIRMRALALEAGAAGAVIRIRNLDSNKEFVGQVINETQVQVRF
jgi:flagella basal body P-ring formation protein FlgA